MITRYNLTKSITYYYGDEYEGEHYIIIFLNFYYYDIYENLNVA